MRRRKSFPFWITGGTWVFVALTLAALAGSASLEWLGFNPGPADQLLPPALPAFVAGALLWADWRDNQERPR